MSEQFTDSAADYAQLPFLSLIGGDTYENRGLIEARLDLPAVVKSIEVDAAPAGIRIYVGEVVEETLSA